MSINNFIVQGFLEKLATGILREDQISPINPLDNINTAAPTASYKSTSNSGWKGIPYALPSQTSTANPTSNVTPKATTAPAYQQPQTVGNPDAAASNNSVTTPQFKTRGQAFNYYHKLYGNDGTFEYGGKKYTTQMAGSSNSNKVQTSAQSKYTKPASKAVENIEQTDVPNNPNWGSSPSPRSAAPGFTPTPNNTEKSKWDNAHFATLKDMGVKPEEFERKTNDLKWMRNYIYNKKQHYNGMSMDLSNVYNQLDKQQKNKAGFGDL